MSEPKLLTNPSVVRIDWPAEAKREGQKLAAAALVQLLQNEAAPVGVNEQPVDLQKMEFKLYPNPSQGWIVAEFGQPVPHDVRLAIHNAMGQKLEEFTIPAGATEKTLRVALPSGIYWVVARDYYRLPLASVPGASPGLSEVRIQPLIVAP